MSPGTLDRETVRRHLAELDRALGRLQSHRGRPLSDLAGEELWIVERGLQLCAQNVVDIAVHITASAGRAAREYRESLLRLGEMGVLPTEFAASFANVAGFRNVLVHGYLEIDVARVHGFLNEQFDDFIEFARHVDLYLEGVAPLAG